MTPGMLTSSPAQLAAQVRQRLVSQASALLGPLAAQVHERFIALMDEAAPSREMQVRRDAWMSFQQRKAHWQDATLKAWQAALVAPTKPTTPSLRGELELLGTEVVENKIIASRLALNLMEKNAQVVNDLRKRLKFLNNDQPLHTNDIVQPETLFLHLVEQWEACGLSRESWQLASLTVQRHLNEQLPPIYAQCNELLVAQGVLEDIEAASRPMHSASKGDEAASDEPERALSPAEKQFKRRADDQSATRGRVSDAGGGNAGGHDAGGRDAGVGRGQAGGGGAPRIGSPNGGSGWRFGRAQGILEQVGRLLSGAFLEAAPPGGAVVSEGVDSSPVGMPSARSGLSGQASMTPSNMPFGGTGIINPGAMVSGMIGGGGGGAPQVAYAGPSVPLMVAMAQQPRLSDVHFAASQGGTPIAYPVAIAQMASELRQQSADLKVQAETDNEKAIIELVALMFQSILQEDRIPPGARVWFARLQMPVLRIALADPDFFNKADHPARQLIDHMGSCVLGFDSSGISTEALETEIKRVVQVIEQYPETGDRVYKRVYEEFQAFLKQHLAKKPATQKVLGVAEQLEQKETLAIQYTIELRDQLKDMPVRDEIRSFLFKEWAEVLAVSTVRQGKQHAETLLLKKAATDLIWAASAKPNRADRAKVIDGLPDLLQCLRTGMTLLGTAKSAQEAHIKIISDTLADAFMSKTEAIADEQIQAMAKRLAELDDYVSEDSGEELPLDTDNIEELLGIEATELDVVNEGGGTSSPVMMEWARELALGSWFTLNYKTNLVQVQFVWRSPLGHLHLFATSVGHSYLFQTVRLASYLQAALLEPQEEEPLTARAARSALGEIQANPQRLLN